MNTLPPHRSVTRPTHPLIGENARDGGYDPSFDTDIRRRIDLERVRLESGDIPPARSQHADIALPGPFYMEQQRLLQNVPEEERYGYGWGAQNAPQKTDPGLLQNVYAFQDVSPDDEHTQALAGPAYDPFWWHYVPEFIAGLVLIGVLLYAIWFR